MRTIDEAVDQEGIGAIFNLVGRRGCFRWRFGFGSVRWRFGQQNEVICVDMDVAFGVHVIEQLTEFGAGESGTARTGIIKIAGVSRMLGNKRNNCLAEGGDIFFVAIFFRMSYHINISHSVVSCII